MNRKQWMPEMVKKNKNKRIEGRLFVDKELQWIHLAEAVTGCTSFCGGKKTYDATEWTDVNC